MSPIIKNWRGTQSREPGDNWTYPPRRAEASARHENGYALGLLRGKGISPALDTPPAGFRFLKWRARGLIP